MRIGIVGAGAVGGYFGARLLSAGEDVSFLARGKTLQVLRDRGLRLDSPSGALVFPSVRASNRWQELGSVDLILVAVKAWQVRSVADQIAPWVGEGVVVLPLQNGVEACGDLQNALTAGAVLDGFCKVIARAEAPGHIVQVGETSSVEFGEVDGTLSPRVQALAACFEKAGLSARVSEDIRADVWGKFLFIGPVSGLGALTRAPLGVLRETAETRQILTQAMEEVVAVGRAHGVRLPDEAIDRTLAFLDSLPAESTASMQRDIMSGRPSELEAQCGAVVRLGAAKGVETPVNQMIYGCLLPQEKVARAS